MKKVVIGLMMILTLASCQNSRNGNGDKIVATVYDKILYQSDLQDVLYEGISFNDSLVRTKAFIDKWIRRQLLIHQAENTIDKSELDFSRQMEDYRNSLIIYKYESMLVEQNLDTVISEEEIEKYLKDNSPIEMDSVSVRNILLNMRRKELIEKMNNNLYNKAVKERVFKIY
ncbi:MAG: hypothetical protein II817_09815 [Bacteroidales bacterium]|jgi:uncharacterized protein YneF (UPF0154 family)|nr:hypothetical protein [Bacteroidales bacterium]